MLDPHTAIGVKAARDNKKDGDILVTLATAHPAKFPEAIKASNVKEADLPDHLSDLYDRDEEFDILENDIETVKEFI